MSKKRTKASKPLANTTANHIELEDCQLGDGRSVNVAKPQLEPSADQGFVDFVTDIADIAREVEDKRLAKIDGSSVGWWVGKMAPIPLS